MVALEVKFQSELQPLKRMTDMLMSDAGAAFVECLDLTRDNEAGHSTIQEIRVKGQARTVRVKTVGYLDLTQDEDAPSFSLLRVQQKDATTMYSTSEEALEAVLKKRIKQRSRAAKSNKRLKASVIDLTGDEAAPTRVGLTTGHQE
jgi:hypothetical protein